MGFGYSTPASSNDNYPQPSDMASDLSEWRKLKMEETKDDTRKPYEEVDFKTGSIQRFTTHDWLSKLYENKSLRLMTPPHVASDARQERGGVMYYISSQLGLHSRGGTVISWTDRTAFDRKEINKFKTCMSLVHSTGLILAEPDCHTSNPKDYAGRVVRPGIPFATVQKDLPNGGPHGFLRGISHDGYVYTGGYADTDSTKLDMNVLPPNSLMMSVEESSAF